MVNIRLTDADVSQSPGGYTVDLMGGGSGEEYKRMGCQLSSCRMGGGSLCYIFLIPKVMQ